MFGLDHLGIAKYGKVARETQQDGLAIGAFGGVFGNSLPAIDKILIKGKCPAVRIHLAWRDDHKFGLKQFLFIKFF